MTRLTRERLNEIRLRTAAIYDKRFKRTLVGNSIQDVHIKDLLREIDAIEAENKKYKEALSKLRGSKRKEVRAPCSVCGEPDAKECGYASNEVCTRVVCEKHKHSHGIKTPKQDGVS